MAIDIEKPLPLMVGNKAYYSLTSYDPVEITVEVPYSTNEDIEMGLTMTLRDLGGSLDDLNNPDWVSEHFEGLTTPVQVREAIRQQMNAMNAQIAEEQKLGKCVEALVGRLKQAVPPQHVEQAKEAVRMRFTQQLEAEGMTPQQFMQRTRTTPAQLEAMFDRQAQQMVEGDAALSAYAHEKKLKVDEHEYSRLLGISPQDLEQVKEQARAVGQLDQLHEAALRAKAAQAVVAECSCTYHHETPEQARARVAQYRRMQEMLGNDEPADDQSSGESKTGFKLV